MIPKPGQHLLVPADAACDRCRERSHGRLIYRNRNLLLCRACDAGEGPTPEPTPDTAPALACPACGGAEGEGGICVACARRGVFMTMREGGVRG